MISVRDAEIELLKTVRAFEENTKRYMKLTAEKERRGALADKSPEESTSRTSFLSGSSFGTGLQNFEPSLRTEEVSIKTRIRNLGLSQPKAKALVQRSKQFKNILKTDKVRKTDAMQANARITRSHTLLSASESASASLSARVSAGRRLRFPQEDEKKSIDDPFYHVKKHATDMTFYENPVFKKPLASVFSNMLHERKARELFTRLGQYILLAWVSHDVDETFETYFSEPLSAEFTKVVQALKPYYNINDPDEMKKVLEEFLDKIEASAKNVGKEFETLSKRDQQKFNLSYADFRRKLAALDKKLIEFAVKDLLKCEIRKLLAVYVLLRHPEVGVLDKESEVIEGILNSSDYKTYHDTLQSIKTLKELTEFSNTINNCTNNYYTIASAFSTPVFERIEATVLTKINGLSSDLIALCRPWMQQTQHEWGSHAGFSVRLALKLARFRYEEEKTSLKTSKCQIPEIQALINDNKSQDDKFRLPENVLKELVQSSGLDQTIYRLYYVRAKMKAVSRLSLLFLGVKDQYIASDKSLLQSVKVEKEFKEYLHELQTVMVNFWERCFKEEFEQRQQRHDENVKAIAETKKETKKEIDRIKKEKKAESLIKEIKKQSKTLNEREKKANRAKEHLEDLLEIDDLRLKGAEKGELPKKKTFSKKKTRK